jgi:hypothetical protein
MIGIFASTIEHGVNFDVPIRDTRPNIISAPSSSSDYSSSGGSGSRLLQATYWQQRKRGNYVYNTSRLDENQNKGLGYVSVSNEMSLLYLLSVMNGFLW